MSPSRHGSTISSLQERALRAAADLARLRIFGLIATGFGWQIMTKAERSLKAKRQLRDRFGRFIEMGGSMAWKDAQGQEQPGRFLGIADNGDVLVADKASAKIRRVKPDDVRSIEARASLNLPESGNAISDPFDLDGDGHVSAEEARAAISEAEKHEYKIDYDSIERGASFSQMGYEPHRGNEVEIQSAIEDRMEDAYKAYFLTARLSGQIGKEDFLSREEVARRAAEMIASTLDAPPVSRAPIEALGAIIVSGALKSQFETNTSSGVLSHRARSAVEAAIMNVPDDIAPHLRPIYAATDEDGTEGYGEVVILFNDSVRERCTATFGDSLDDGAALAIHVSDLREMEPDDLTPLATTGKFSSESLGTLVAEDQMGSLSAIAANELVAYQEIQIHGGVGLDEISEMYVPSFDRWGRGPWEEYDSSLNSTEGYVINALDFIGITLRDLEHMGARAEMLLRSLFRAASGLEDGESLSSLDQFQDFLNNLVRINGGKFKVTLET